MTISAAHSRRLSESASASARFLSCGDGAVYVRAACVIVCACDSACSSQQRRPSPRLASRRGHTVPGRLRHHAHVRSRKSCACVEEVGVSGCSLACLLRRWSYPDVSPCAHFSTARSLSPFGAVVTSLAQVDLLGLEKCADSKTDSLAVTYVKGCSRLHFRGGFKAFRKAPGRPNMNICARAFILRGLPCRPGTPP